MHAPTRRLTAVTTTALAAVAATVLAAAPAPQAAAAGRSAIPAPQAAAAPAPIWPAAGAKAPAVPAVTWRACPEAAQRRLRLECGTVKVPLDYANPAGPTITLDLARHKATGTRKGAVFVNPGGPGGSAVAGMERFLAVLGTPVTSSLDVIGLDPRGIGEHTKASCWSTRPEPELAPDVPTTPKEIALAVAHDDYERTACAATGRPIIDHMSTGDVARDHDLVRQALREPSMTYYGVSYGTVLAQTYAAMFPSKVRAMVLDGVVDPVAWTTGHGTTGTTVPVSARGGSGAGADETLRAAFAACKTAGARRCPHGATIARERDLLVARLRRGPVETAGGTLRLGDVVTGALHSMYSPDTFAGLMTTIHEQYVAIGSPRFVSEPARRAISRPLLRASASTGTAATPRTAAAATRSTSLGLGDVAPTKPMPDDVSWWDCFTQAGVMCSDSVNPSAPAAWSEYAKAQSSRSWFTAAWAWNSSLCARWPGRTTGAYRGPFTVKPAHPLLVVGNLHDPATPITAARAVAAMSPGARLLTVDAFGHTTADLSTCASAAMRTYLVSGRLPAVGLTCRADRPLF